MASIPIFLATIVMSVLQLQVARAHVNIDSDEGLEIEIITEPPTSPPTRTPPNDRVHRRAFDPLEVIDIKQYPFLASVIVHGEMWCAAAVIKQNMVLATARCLEIQFDNRFFREYLKLVSVRVGSSSADSGGEVFRVDDIDFHPNYKPQTLEYNLVVLKLHRSINFFKDNVPVDIIRYATNNYVPVDKNISFIGWGSVASTDSVSKRILMQKVELPIYDLSDCMEVYGEELVTRMNFCAGYISLLKNICNHDAGGAAVMDGALVGMLTFSNKLCNELDKPAVFTSVGPVSDWLDSLDHPEEWKKKSLNLFDI